MVPLGSLGTVGFVNVRSLRWDSVPSLCSEAARELGTSKEPGTTSPSGKLASRLLWPLSLPPGKLRDSLVARSWGSLGSQASLSLPPSLLSLKALLLCLSHPLQENNCPLTFLPLLPPPLPFLSDDSDSSLSEVLRYTQKVSCVWSPLALFSHFCLSLHRPLPPAHLSSACSPSSPRTLPPLRHVPPETSSCPMVPLSQGGPVASDCAGPGWSWGLGEGVRLLVAHPVLFSLLA
ncbi:Hypothetical predicted protein [Marmota monax]|uniref:Uncharacterized protein n=1 Tax=Marmota monax TaxID=9995 RepID=A0A5E4AI39_MARMO|nr:Hypothetical predicted protein [Marmota monax]